LTVLLAPLKVPLATAAYTLVGLVLAKYWYDGVYWPTWVALLGAVALAVGIAPAARSLITRRPKAALRAFESYAWLNGLLAAVATCATVLVTVKLSAVAGEKDPVKELITQASTALTALIGGVVVATKDQDETLGKWIAKEFQAKFTVRGQEAQGQGPQAQDVPGLVTLKPDSASLIALHTKYENGWTDWSKDNRVARVECLHDNLAADRV
jgi:hypothetical protein